MTVTEAARRLGFTRPWIYELLRRGELRRSPDGLVDPASVDRYLATRP